MPLTEVQSEGKWAIVVEQLSNVYTGNLGNQSVSIAPSETMCLCFGVEVSFLPKHFINICERLADYAEWRRGPQPAQR